MSEEQGMALSVINTTLCLIIYLHPFRRIHHPSIDNSQYSGLNADLMKRINPRNCINISQVATCKNEYRRPPDKYLYENTI